MKKELVRLSVPLFYMRNGERIGGIHYGLFGDCTGLSGDCTGLRGDCTGLHGDCTGVHGDCTGVRGDFDACDISDEERKHGICVKTLIKEG